MLSAVLMTIGMLLSGGCASLSPAAEAIKANDFEGLRRALDSGVSPDYVEVAPPLRGVSLVHLAVTNYRDDMTELLFQRGANPNLHVGQWLRDANVSDTPYHLSMAKTMFAHGLDPNIQFPSGRRPLHYSCNSPQIIELFISKGAAVDESSGPWLNESERATPLGICLFEISDLNTSMKSLEGSNDSNDPIHVRARQTSIEYFTERREQTINGAIALLKHGANPNALLTEGVRRTSLILAAGEVEPPPKYFKTPYLLKAAELKQPRLVEAFLDHGADIFAQSEKTGETVLHGLAKNGDPSVLRRAIMRAKLQMKKQRHTALEANNILFSWLDHTSVEGKTAMHLAGSVGRMDVIQVLIENGADASLRDKSGRTTQQLVAEKIERDEAARVAAKEDYRRRMEQADENARQAAANRQGTLAILGSVALAKGMSGGNYTGDQRRAVIDSYVKDRANAANGIATDSLGQSVATVKRDMDLALLSSQTRARLTTEAKNSPNRSTTSLKESLSTPQVDTARAQPKTLAASVPMRSGQACGNGKRCVAGNGYTQWCSGPDTGGPHCVSGCEMTSRAAYHDTSLSSNVAHTPSGIPCQPGCTVPNPCD
jgi:ankyrin repeat protein